MILAGRGWGKTRTGAEDAAYFGINSKGIRQAIIAPTFADARDTCIEGESGLLSCIPPEMVKDWNRSIGELYLHNGSSYRVYTAEKPDRLRGPQHHRAWCDEVGSWKYAEETYDMLQFGMRLGVNPQSVFTTTPKPIKLLRDLIKDPNTVMSSGSTYENRENLPESFFRRIIAKYEGSRLGLQELYAKILDDIPGALWTRDLIEKTRIKDQYPEQIAKLCNRIVIAIDPAVTSGEDADETGISAVGQIGSSRGVVLADASCRDKARVWAQTAIDLYFRFRADCIVGEVNNGGDLVEEVIHTLNPNVPFRKVTATRGKFKRAEPISTLYEQGRIAHVGLFEKLEDQMCMFIPDDDGINNASPDRADAMVWGFTELFGDCMNLGLLEYAKEEAGMRKMDKASDLIKPDMGVQQTACPECGSKAISRLGPEWRCNQCGIQFGGKELTLPHAGGGRVQKGGGRYV